MRHMDQAWFPHTRLDRHLISQLNAHSRSPSLSHTPLCSFSNPQFLSLSLSRTPSIICFFQSLILTPSISPWTLLHFSISYLFLCHTIHRPSGIFHPTPLSPRRSLSLSHPRTFNEQKYSRSIHSNWLTLGRYDLVTLWPYFSSCIAPVRQT